MFLCQVPRLCQIDRLPCPVIRRVGGLEDELVSQSELAKYLKSRGRTSELLTGKRCPSKAEIAILRELLGLSADILIPRVHLEEPCPKN